jgi:hypothetical protein
MNPDASQRLKQSRRGHGRNDSYSSADSSFFIRPAEVRHLFQQLVDEVRRGCAEKRSMTGRQLDEIFPFLTQLMVTRCATHHLG